MENITFTAGIRKFNIKSGEGTPELSIELGKITGLNSKAQSIIDNMNGPVVVTLKPVQSNLEFGKIPPGVKIEPGPGPEKPKSKRKRKDSYLK